MYREKLKVMTPSRNKLIYLLPLFVIELYLLFTLIVLNYGPVTYKLHNVYSFYLFIIFYHIAFILGYLYSANKLYSGDARYFGFTTGCETFIIKYFWIFYFFALIASLIMFKNAVNNQSIIPYNIFEKINLGLHNPRLARDMTNYSYSSSPQNSVFITFFYALTAVFRYSLLPIMIFFWGRLNLLKKVFGSILAFFPLTAAVSTGTNAYAILIFFVAFVSILILILRKLYFKEHIKHFKLTIITAFSMVIICISVFLIVMSSRMNTQDLYSMELAAPKGEVVFSKSIENSGIVASFAKIDFYLVQGYYGMSLALSEEFTPTYGVGSSQYLLVFIDKHLGTNLNENTYQHKITRKWDEKAAWHSFYSQMANDFSFIGVIFLMFFDFEL